MFRLLCCGMLLVCLPCAATTVYKWVDEAGLVSFSDQPPVGGAGVETIHVSSPPPVPDTEVLARLERIRETTDRMAADRREREAMRAQNRRQQMQELAPVPQSAPHYPIYIGRAHRPVIRPPLRPPPLHPQLPPGRPAITTPYPEKLIRQRYPGAAARIFNPTRYEASGH